MLARWPASTTTEHVITRYGRTAVTVAGPPDAPPLVLLHGGGATSTVWYATAAHLVGRYRIFAVERLGEAGLGAAERPIGSVADLVDWLGGVLRACGVERAPVVGHSYGAWLALRYAIDRPHRVSALALLDPTDCFGRLRSGYLRRSLPLLVAPTPDRARALVGWESTGVAIDPDWLDLYAAGTEVPHRLPPRPILPSDAELAGVAAPTMIMLAGMSRVHEARRVRLAVLHRMPDAAVAMIGHATHHSMPFQPAGEINTLLSGFLRRCVDQGD
jgi:pimeloyl-ACP methyl ester carboxylesterase